LGAIRPFVPERLVEAAIRLKGPLRHQLESSRAAAVAAWGGALPLRSEGPSRFPLKLGVLRDAAFNHVNNLLACREMGIAFQVIDLEASRWLERARTAECDAFLPWPSTNVAVWKEIYDERLPLLAEATGRPIVPSPAENWLLESKRRVRDWLLVHDVPHPRTEVFYEEGVALDFIRSCALPLVLKTNGGASSHGVFVLRSRQAARRLVRRAFREGVRIRRGDPRDRAWGHVILQEYISHDHEWRVVRIGDDFQCRRKTRVGDFASGAGAVEWAVPSVELLEFARNVTELGRFRSMGLDIFIDERAQSPRFRVNEMQCLIGAAPQEEHPARGRWWKDGDTWRFEQGDYYRNACANLRIKWLLQELGFALDYSDLVVRDTLTSAARAI
jgi:glutathione synthase/RimK-type ligase-like ATP-grasp enzyme